MSTAEKTKLAEEHREALLREETAAAAAGGGGFSWLTALGFAFLTFNSAMAIYRSVRPTNSDAGARSRRFVAFSGGVDVDLVILPPSFLTFNSAMAIRTGPTATRPQWPLWPSPMWISSCSSAACAGSRARRPARPREAS